MHALLNQVPSLQIEIEISKTCAFMQKFNVCSCAQESHHVFFINVNCFILCLTHYCEHYTLTTLSTYCIMSMIAIIHFVLMKGTVCWYMYGYMFLQTLARLFTVCMRLPVYLINTCFGL